MVIDKKIKLKIFIASSLYLALFVTSCKAVTEGEAKDKKELYPPMSQNLSSDHNIPQYAPGELIVKLKEGKILEDIKELNAKYNIISTEKVFKETTDPNLEHTYLLKINPSADILSASKDYSDNPNIEYAEPNYIAKTQVLPTKPLIN